jgi:hypothetical protein
VLRDKIKQNFHSEIPTCELCDPILSLPQVQLRRQRTFANAALTTKVSFRGLQCSDRSNDGKLVWAANDAGRSVWLIRPNNRLPRPLITYTIFGLFLMVIIDPLQFAATMQALTLVPAQLWELLSVIVMFFFGARELSHFRSDSMAKEAARITASVPVVIENIQKILHPHTPGVAYTNKNSDTASEANPAVQDFYETRRN